MGDEILSRVLSRWPQVELSACKSVHWESFQCKIMVTCESTAEEVSYEWSHYNYDFVNMIFIVRTCLHSITPVSIADVNCTLHFLA